MPYRLWDGASEVARADTMQELVTIQEKLDGGLALAWVRGPDGRVAGFTRTDAGRKRALYRIEEV